MSDENLRMSTIAKGLKDPHPVVKNLQFQSNKKVTSGQLASVNKCSISNCESHIMKALAKCRKN